MLSSAVWVNRLFGNAARAGTIRNRGVFARGARRGRPAVVDLSHRGLRESVGEPQLPGPRLKPAASWAYQLQAISVATIAACPADVVVIDSSADGSVAKAFTQADIAVMRARTNAAPKKMICYMSIGEAEAQRFYWKSDWIKRGTRNRDAPSWLADLNGEGWEGNFKVRFWDPDWQSILIDRPDSFLNRIIGAGFDGVYLDIIDAYDYWMDSDRGSERRPTADAEMVALVQRIAHHARVVKKARDFAVIPQNGEALLKYPEYRAAISAIGKEDILFSMAGMANRRPHVKKNDPKKDVEPIMASLRLALADRIPVLAVEYLRDWPADAAKIGQALQQMREFGLVPHFGRRLLDQLSAVEVPMGAGGAVS